MKQTIVLFFLFLFAISCQEEIELLLSGKTFASKIN